MLKMLMMLILKMKMMDGLLIEDEDEDEDDDRWSLIQPITIELLPVTIDNRVLTC